MESYYNVLAEIGQSSRLADAKLVLDDKTEYQIHRVILSLHSKFFNMLFKHEEGKNIYTIKDVTKRAMDQIISWCYTGKMCLTEANIEEVLRWGHYLDCPEVVREGCNFLMADIGPENAVGFWTVSQAYQIKELEDLVVAFMMKNLESISKGDEYLELSPDELTMLLQMEWRHNEKALFLPLV